MSDAVFALVIASLLLVASYLAGYLVGEVRRTWNERRDRARTVRVAHDG